MAIKIIKTRDALQAQTQQWRDEGLQIGFVPTMGALHEGHLALVEQITPQVDKVIISIYVNPKQFAEGEDFDIYPRMLAEDAKKLSAQAAHADYILYAPNDAEIYPEGFATYLHIEGPALGLESDKRFPYFDGMALMVLKLFMQCQPHIAIFGEKDYQQLLVARRFVADLDIPIKILAAPTVREADGLALSSRNMRLSPAERKIASQLNVILAKVAKAAAGVANPADFAEIEAEGTSALLAAGFERVDYLVVRDAETLVQPSAKSKHLRVLVAAQLGTVRLLDNMPVIMLEK